MLRLTAFILNKEVNRVISEIGFLNSEIECKRYHHELALKCVFNIYVLSSELFAIYKKNPDIIKKYERDINKNMKFCYCRVLVNKGGQLLVFVSVNWHKTLRVMTDLSTFWTTFIKAFK